MAPPARGSVVVVGSLNVDTTVDVAHLPQPGETVIATGVRGALGGKGSNQAVAAARQGVPTSFIACVGDDAEGRTALDRIAAEGVDVRYCRVRAGERTGQAYIAVDAAGANTVIVAPGANAALGPVDIPTGINGVVLVQLEIPDDAVTAALQRGHVAGAVTILNPAPARALRSEWLDTCDILVPNETEAAALTGTSRPRDAAALLARQIPRATIVVTCGSDGALVRTPGGVVLAVPAPVLHAVDTVAAGDAFCGVLAAGLATGLDIGEAVRRAVAGGAHAVTVPGALPSLPTRADVERLLRD